MKITINRILMFLQAIFMLAGHPIMAMEIEDNVEVVNDPSVKVKKERGRPKTRHSDVSKRNLSLDSNNKRTVDSNSRKTKSLSRSKYDISNIDKEGDFLTLKAAQEKLSDLIDNLNNIDKSIHKFNKEYNIQNTLLKKIVQQTDKLKSYTEDLKKHTVENHSCSSFFRCPKEDFENNIDLLSKDLDENMEEYEKLLSVKSLFTKINKFKKDKEEVEEKIEHFEKEVKRLTPSYAKRAQNFVAGAKPYVVGAKDYAVKTAGDSITSVGNKAVNLAQASKNYTIDIAQGSLNKSIVLGKIVGNGAVASANYAKNKSIYLANNVTTKATESIDYAKETKDAVKNSVLVDNAFVNTLSALGTTVYNTLAGGVQKVDNYVRTGLDLFGPNVEQNVYIPLSKAQEQYNTIAINDLGKMIVPHDDMSIALATNNEKIRAMQAIIEILVVQGKLDPSTMTDALIITPVTKSLNLYKPIKQQLENVLSVSYAEISDRNSLVMALQNIASTEITVEKVEQQAELCKQAVEKRFVEWKEQEKASITKESTQEFKNKVEVRCAQYDDIMKTIHEAIALYTYVFLIDAQLKSLELASKVIADEKTNETIIAKAIVQYNKYCDVLTKYKKAKEHIDESKILDLVKEEVVNGTIKNNADLIIKMTSSGKDALTINLDLADFSTLVYNYVNTIGELLTVPGCKTITGSYVGGSSIQNYLQSHVNYFNKNNDQLTGNQQKHVQLILNDIKTESDELYAMTKKCLSYGSFHNIFDIQTLYTTLEKEKKGYEKQLKSFKMQNSDKMENVSLEMLTVHRSEGIAELLKTHKSERKMITWAENEQAAYADRQTKRKVILDRVDRAISGRVITLDQIANHMGILVNGDKLPTDEDLEGFDVILDEFRKDLENRSYKFTTDHRAFVETIAQEAIEDAKKNVKIHIVAGWTVVGVMAKTAFEGLTHTKGSSVKSIAKRGLGKALNAVRKGLIATGNAIAAENYHEKMRDNAGKKVQKGFKKVSSKFKEGWHALEEELENTQKPTLKPLNGSQLKQTARNVRQNVGNNIQTIVPSITRGNNTVTLPILRPGSIYAQNNNIPISTNTNFGNGFYEEIYNLPIVAQNVGQVTVPGIILDELFNDPAIDNAQNKNIIKIPKIVATTVNN